MAGVQDFTNAAKLRRGPGGALGDARDGGAGSGAGGPNANQIGGKLGLGGIENVLKTEDLIPYCSKDVSMHN